MDRGEEGCPSPTRGDLYDIIIIINTMMMMMMCNDLNCTQKLTKSQLSLVHRCRFSENSAADTTTLLLHGHQTD